MLGCGTSGGDQEPSSSPAQVVASFIDNLGSGEVGVACGLLETPQAVMSSSEAACRSQLAKYRKLMGDEIGSDLASAPVELIPEEGSTASASVRVATTVIRFELIRASRGWLIRSVDLPNFVRLS